MKQEEIIDGEPDAELARWLVEVGRRRILRRRDGAPPALPACADRRSRGVVRITLLGLLGAAWLQYFYLDALLEIAGLRSLIVFALARVAA